MIEKRSDFPPVKKTICFHLEDERQNQLLIPLMVRDEALENDGEEVRLPGRWQMQDVAR